MGNECAVTLACTADRLYCYCYAFLLTQNESILTQNESIELVHDEKESIPGGINNATAEQLVPRIRGFIIIRNVEVD